MITLTVYTLSTQEGSESVRELMLCVVLLAPLVAAAGASGGKDLHDPTRPPGCGSRR